VAEPVRAADFLDASDPKGKGWTGLAVGQLTYLPAGTWVRITSDRTARVWEGALISTGPSLVGPVLERIAMRTALRGRSELNLPLDHPAEALLPDGYGPIPKRDSNEEIDEIIRVASERADVDRPALPGPAAELLARITGVPDVVDGELA
jgi:hypothetical protein